MSGWVLFCCLMLFLIDPSFIGRRAAEITKAYRKAVEGQE